MIWGYPYLRKPHMILDILPPYMTKETTPHQSDFLSSIYEPSLKKKEAFKKFKKVWIWIED